MHDDLSSLATDLKNADEALVLEIIREAEKFLDSQLTAGIAADQRAVTFSSILAATAAVLIGGLIAAPVAPASHLAWVIVPVVLGFLVATIFAMVACRPTGWSYAGSNPRHWREDAKGNVSLRDALADQAKLYAEAIIKNRDVLDANARLMTWAFGWASATIAIGGIIAIYLSAT